MSVILCGRQANTFSSKHQSGKHIIAAETVEMDYNTNVVDTGFS